MQVSPAELLNFWFGDNLNSSDVLKPRIAQWFNPQPDFDEEIRQRFGALPERAAAGELDDWMAEARSSLALVLILDQFPRNLFRGTPQAFQYDSKGQHYALTALEAGFDRAVHPIEALFFYMPLEHAEDLILQNCCVELLEKLVLRTTTELHKFVRQFAEYAVRHQKVIERFGRFPHRNAVLGRASTPEEIAYLQEGGENFGVKPTKPS